MPTDGACDDFAKSIFEFHTLIRELALPFDGLHPFKEIGTGDDEPGNLACIWPRLYLELNYISACSVTVVYQLEHFQELMQRIKRRLASGSSYKNADDDWSCCVKCYQRPWLLACS